MRLLSILSSLLLSLLFFSSQTFALDAAALKAKAMNPETPRMERIKAIKALYSDQLVDGQIPERKICVWDIAGRSGPIFAAAIDQQVELLEMGVRIQLDAYTNEGVLADDLQAGHCDAALFTGLRARLFNKFAGTIDAIGAIPSNKHMNLLMRVLTHPKFAPKMTESNYVVLGLASMGSAYMFVNDKSINSLAKAAGKRIVVMDYDPIQAEMILGLGANPVPSSLVNAGNKFNNHAVDILPAPLVAYQIMELDRGIGDNGGIINYPFSQLTLQLIGRADKFPAEIAQIMREDFFARFESIEKQVNQQIGAIPDEAWVEIPDADKAEYRNMMRDVRITLRDRGYYDGSMLRLIRKIRCKFEPSDAECTNPLE